MSMWLRYRFQQRAGSHLSTHQRSNGTQRWDKESALAQRQGSEAEKGLSAFLPLLCLNSLFFKEERLEHEPVAQQGETFTYTEFPEDFLLLQNLFQDSLIDSSTL